MPGFLMWNVQRKPLDALVLALVDEHKPDILLLVERPVDVAALVAAMTTRGFALAPSEARFALFHRAAKASVERFLPDGKGDREDHWRVRWGTSLDLHLVAVHGPDRVNYGEERRGVWFLRLLRRVRWMEDLLGHSRTVVLGDFNANPFDPSVYGTDGLHAVNVSHVGGRDRRTVMHEDYRLFYNPMWCCFGRHGQPRGTYYLNRSDIRELFWHMPDQVVFRPELMPVFPESRLHVLVSAGGASLLTEAGIPDRDGASDHLPVVFRINRPTRRRAHA
jgi:hypothetical protein